MFTHARCGGVLLPIADPEWLVVSPFPYMGAGHIRSVLPARCNRCGLAGEVIKQNHAREERRALYRGLVRK